MDVPVGTLWLVATPIGSLGDLAPRACDVLARVDVVVAEDTRRTRALLSHAGIPAGRRLRSLHEHNERARVPQLVDELRDGRDIALVSDAGTPVLSDPGYLLVRAVREADLPVRSVPGPSSFVAALAAAGQPPLPAILVGFLPPRAGPRRRRVAELATWPATLVVLLSPHRLTAELSDLAGGLGDGRPATLLAELSKVHERASMSSLGALAAAAAAEPARGEHVLVVGPPPVAAAPTVDGDAARAAYQRALAAGLPRADALRAAAADLGLPRRALYRLLVDDQGDEKTG